MIRRPHLAFAAALAALAAAAATGTLAGAAAPVRVERELRYGPDAAQVLDAFLPRGRSAGRRAAVVLIHGGGWREGEKEHYRKAGTELARRGWVAFAIDYRLAPAARFPAAVDDTFAAVRWIRAHARRFGVDPRRLGAFGGSAGANLAALLAVRGDVRAAVAWSPPTDLAALGAHPHTRLGAIVAGYLGCSPAVCPARYRAASPAAQVRPGSAPLLLVNSTDELIPLAQALVLDHRLARARVPHALRILPGTLHADAYAREQWAPSLAFLERYLGALPRA
jgi:acetyl esterase/lipase